MLELKLFLRVAGAVLLDVLLVVLFVAASLASVATLSWLSVNGYPWLLKALGWMIGGVVSILMLILIVLYLSAVYDKQKRARDSKSKLHS